MSKRREIENDEVFRKAEYHKFLLAAYLDEPLRYTPEERERQMAIYDRTCKMIERYRRGRLVQKYPRLREQYDRLGWEYQEFEGEYDPVHDFLETDPPPEVEPSAEPPKTPLAAPEQPPPPEPKQDPPKPKPSISAWLDD
ncbi:hypothetical protein D3C74_188840 [compost metagenome]